MRQLDADTWLYALGTTKTDTTGARREKPLCGQAAQALAAWLAAAPAESGPLFRRLYKGGKIGTSGLSADQVARIVQRRAQLAGLEGDWAAHSLRSGSAPYERNVPMQHLVESVGNFLLLAAPHDSAAFSADERMVREAVDHFNPRIDCERF